MSQLQQTDWIAASMPAARKRRDAGIERVERGAGEKWLEEAATYIRHYAGMLRTGFLVEDVADRWAAAKMPAPRDARAWGGAVRRAARAGWIKRAGYAPARTSNLSPKVLWVVA